jgi:hypothetical protein
VGKERRIATPGTANGVITKPGASETWSFAAKKGTRLILDVNAGQISGVEIAVWPNVRKRAELSPPSTVEDACVVVGAVERGKRLAVEVETKLDAEADRAERTIHFRVGGSRETRTVRIARHLLLDIDGRNRIAGLWLLDVPPFPVPT